uniref:Uncharacterized protein n=1 Tax=Romanomermis culicivorax TaxID=13658 RepID=A0A915KNL7_ROMCU
MWAIWSADLAKKYSHLPLALLNEPFQVEALMGPDMVLSGPVVLQVLGPEITRRALEFISNDTIRVIPVNKLPLEGEPSSLAVDAVCHAVKQASRIAQPALAIAALPPTMMTSVQMLSAIAQQQPSATTTNSPTLAANAFGEMLHTINDNVSIIE